jgi:hypothetical protein
MLLFHLLEEIYLPFTDLKIKVIHMIQDRSYGLHNIPVVIWKLKERDG